MVSRIVRFESWPRSLIGVASSRIDIAYSRVTTVAAVPSRHCRFRYAGRSSKRRRSRHGRIGIRADTLVLDGAWRLIDWRSIAFARPRRWRHVQPHTALVAVFATIDIVSTAVVTPDHEVGSPGRRGFPAQAATRLYSRPYIASIIGVGGRGLRVGLRFLVSDYWFLVMQKVRRKPESPNRNCNSETKNRKTATPNS